MNRMLTAGAVALTAVALAPAGLAAQEMGCNFTAGPEELAERRSPADSVSIETDAGAIKICYSQPSARGRDIFGGLVPYDQPWRLGANEPTYLQIGYPAMVGDVAVEPGAYALYAVPGEEEWTIAVNRGTDRWGIPIDESVMADDLGRTTVAAGETGEHVEQLTLSLERAGEAGATLVIEWERTRVEVPIRPQEG